MTYGKYYPPDRVEEAGRAAVATVARKGKAAPSGRDGAMARGESITLAPRDQAEELDAEIKVRKRLNRHGHRWEPDPGDPSRQVEVCPDPVAHAANVEAIGQVLQVLGLLPEPGAAALAIPQGAAAARLQVTGKPTRQQQEKAERMERFARLMTNGGLSPADVARAIGLSPKTGRKYAEALSGTGGAS